MAQDSQHWPPQRDDRIWGTPLPCSWCICGMLHSWQIKAAFCGDQKRMLRRAAASRGHQRWDVPSSNADSSSPFPLVASCLCMFVWCKQFAYLRSSNTAGWQNTTQIWVPVRGMTYLLVDFWTFICSMPNTEGEAAQPPQGRNSLNHSLCICFSTGNRAALSQRKSRNHPEKKKKCSTSLTLKALALQVKT